MSKNIKIGDLVETCSLMPGVVMKVDGPEIQVRMLDVDEYPGNNYACCSLDNCGIVKLNAQETLDRLTLGKNKLIELFNSCNGIHELYYNLIKLAVKNKETGKLE